MAGFTNRGKAKLFQYAFQGTASPGTCYVGLYLSGTAPTADTNVKSDLAEIATGNGYTAGGYALPAGTASWDTITENDGSDLALIQAKDVAWTATGGNIPASGSGARYAALADGTISASNVLAFWDLASDRTVSTGQTLTIQNCELDLTE
jgi:hypothetical protein